MRTPKLQLTLGLGLLISLSFMPSARATLLTFDTTTGGSLNLEAVNSGVDDYGYRVTQFPDDGTFAYGSAGGATPNVIVDYHGATMRGWQYNYGDLANVVYFNGYSNPAPNRYTSRFSLVADEGYSVNLHSFDMGGWQNADMPLNALRILNQNESVLFDSGVTTIEGDGTGAPHSTFSFNVPLTAQRLFIEIDMPIEQTYNVGIDNLLMSQSVVPVPEPGTAFVGVLAGFAAIARRRRRSPSVSAGV